MNKLTGKEIFDNYFKNKPAEQDLDRAMYAYHSHFKDGVDCHSFITTLKSEDLIYDSISSPETKRYTVFRNQRCEWCNRSRIEIRWDDKKPTCDARPDSANATISEILYNEEVKFYSLLKRGEDDIPKNLKRKFNNKVTAEALVYLQTSLGYEPDIVATFIDDDIEPLMEDYQNLMNIHKSKSGEFKNSRKSI